MGEPPSLGTPCYCKVSEVKGALEVGLPLTFSLLKRLKADQKAPFADQKAPFADQKAPFADQAHQVQKRKERLLCTSILNTRSIQWVKTTFYYNPLRTTTKEIVKIVDESHFGPLIL